jgi:WD40 repeat protein
MAATEACPDRQLLQQLLAGSYPPEEQLEPLAAHLESCPRCAETLRGLTGTDTLVGLLAGAKPVPVAGEEAVVARLIERLGQHRSAPGDQDTAILNTEPPPADDLAAVLGPPGGPGELGRLGPYRVMSVLGHGGMGVVLHADDPDLGRAVAVKVMRPALTANPEARRRFTAEARAMAALEHDHIVPVYHVGEERGIPYFVMPLLRGEPLDARLRREGKLPVAEAVRVARQVAEGLAAAHARGLVHRDVKPANIWLEASPERKSGEFRVKLLDFGLARPAEADARLTHSGVLVGTPAYMAPEQARGETANARTDLFGLGCVLYEMLTGRQPFLRKNMTGTLLAVAAESPEPPRQLEPKLPPELNNLVLRLLAKNPPDRPSSAQVVARELERLKLAPRPAGGARRRRRPVLLAVAAAAILVGAAILIPQFVIRLTDEKGNVREIPVPPGTRLEIVPKAPKDATAKKLVKGMLDRLDPASIPAEERLPWQPKELVAVIGRQRPRSLSGAERIALSPDGKYLAIIEYTTPFVRLWDTATLRERAVIGLGTTRLEALTFSADGKWLAMCSCDNGAFLWAMSDLLAGKQTPRDRLLWQASNNPAQVTFAPHGALLAVLHDNALRLFDVARGKFDFHSVTRVDTGPSLAPVFAGDGKLLAITAAKGLELYDVTAKPPSLKAKIPGYLPLALSHNGSTLVARSMSDSKLSLWDLNGAAPKERADVDWGGGEVATFLADGKHLAVGRQDRLTVWDLGVWPPTVTFEQKTDGDGVIWIGLEASRDGSTIATIQGLTNLRLRDGKSDQLRTLMDAQEGTQIALDVSAEGQLWLYDGRFKVSYLDLKAPASQPTEKGTTSSFDVRYHLACISPDHRYLVTGPGASWALTVRELSRPELGGISFNLPGNNGQRVAPAAEAWLPEGHSLVTRSSEGRIDVWDLSRRPPTSRRVTTVASLAEGGSLSAAPVGQTIAANVDNGFKIIDLGGPKPTAETVPLPEGTKAILNPGYAGNYPNNLVFSPDARKIAAVCDWRNIFVWDRVMKQWKEGPKLDGPVYKISWAPDGRSLLLVTNELQWNLGNFQVIWWDLTAGRKLWEWSAPMGLYGAWFAPDGRHAVVGLNNGTVYVLRVPRPATMD